MRPRFDWAKCKGAGRGVGQPSVGPLGQTPALVTGWAHWEALAQTCAEPAVESLVRAVTAWSGGQGKTLEMRWLPPDSTPADEFAPMI